MAIGSNDVAAILGQQQISFGMSNAYAQQLSQMNPLQAFGARQMLPTGQMQQQMAGGQAAVGTIQGAATAGSFAMGGLGLAAAFGYAPRILDPFTSSINAASRGFAAGGMAGGIGMGLATFGGYLAVGAAASAVTDTFIRGASQQVHMQNSIMGNYGVSGMNMSMNMGSATQMANIGMNIADQMGAAGYGNVVNTGTMSNVISQGMAGGQFRGVGSMNEFRQKLQQVTAEAVMMSKLLKTSVENAQQQIQQMNQEFGFTGAGSIGVTATMGRFAGATGMDMNTQLAAMQAGAQVMTSLGGTRASGAMMGLNQAAGISFQRDFGGVDSEFFATRGGAAGISSMYTRGSIGMLSGRGGRRLLSAMMTEEGELDERMAARIAAGAVSREEITRLSRRRLGSAAGRRMFAMNQRELMGDFMGEFGSTGAFRGLQAYSGSDEKGRFNMMVASGLDKQEFGSLERFAMSEGEITRRLDMAHQRGIGGPQKITVGQALSKYFDGLIAPIEKAVEEAGRNAGAAVTGFANRFMGGLTGQGSSALPNFNFAHANRMATRMHHAGMGGARFEHTYRPPSAIPGVIPGVEGLEGPNAVIAALNQFGGGLGGGFGGATLAQPGTFVPGMGTYEGGASFGGVFTPGFNPALQGADFFSAEGLGNTVRGLLPRGVNQLLEGRNPADISFGMSSLLPTGRSALGSALGMGDMSLGGMLAMGGGLSYGARLMMARPLGMMLGGGVVSQAALRQSLAGTSRSGVLAALRAGAFPGAGMSGSIRMGLASGGLTGGLAVALQNLGKRGMGYASSQLSGQGMLGMFRGVGGRAGLAGLGGLTARGAGMFLGSGLVRGLLGPVGFAASFLPMVEDAGEYAGFGAYTGPLATGRGVDNLKALDQAGVGDYLRDRRAIYTSRGGMPNIAGTGFVPYATRGGAEGFFETAGAGFGRLFSADGDEYDRQHGAQVDLMNPELVGRALTDLQASAAETRDVLRDNLQLSTGTFTRRLNAAIDQNAMVGIDILNNTARADAKIGAVLDSLNIPEALKKDLMGDQTKLAGLRMIIAGKDKNLQAPTDFSDTESVKRYLSSVSDAFLGGAADVALRAYREGKSAEVQALKNKIANSYEYKTTKVFNRLAGEYYETRQRVATDETNRLNVQLMTLTGALGADEEAVKKKFKLIPGQEELLAGLETMSTDGLIAIANGNKDAVNRFLAPFVTEARKSIEGEEQPAFSASVNALRAGIPGVAAAVYQANLGEAAARLKDQYTKGYAEAGGNRNLTIGLFGGTFATGQEIGGLIDDMQQEFNSIKSGRGFAKNVQNTVADFGKKIRSAFNDADDAEEAADIIRSVQQAGDLYKSSHLHGIAAQLAGTLRYKTAFKKELGAKADTPVHSLTRRRLAAGLLGGDRQAQRLLGLTGSKENRTSMTNYLKAHGHLPPEVMGEIEALAKARGRTAMMGDVEAQKMADRITTGVQMALDLDPQSLASNDEFTEVVKDASTMAIMADRGTQSPTQKATVGLTQFTKALETAATNLRNFDPKNPDTNPTRGSGDGTN